MAAFRAEGFVLRLGCVGDSSPAASRETYRPRRAFALVAVIDVVLHPLRELLQQECSLKSEFHDGALDASLARAYDIVAVFDLVDAPLELDAFAVIGSFDRGREGGVRRDGLHGAI